MFPQAYWTNPAAPVDRTRTYWYVSTSDAVAMRASLTICARGIADYLWSARSHTLPGRRVAARNAGRHVGDVLSAHMRTLCCNMS